MDILEEVIKTTPRRNPLWYCEKFRQLFEPMGLESFSEDALEILRKRRVLDFIISPGRIGAKVIENSGQAQHVEILLDQFPDESWDKILESLSAKSIFLAQLLAAQLPEQVEAVVTELGLALVPNSIDDLEISYAGEPVSELSAPLAAVLHRLFEQLEKDPFMLFNLRGRGREETLLELRKRRHALKITGLSGSQSVYPQVKYEPAPPLVTTIDRFWEAGEEIKELSYNIKADELPAAILRRLDPLPLFGLEELVDHRLEDAYAHIASRAQAYGLGLE